MTSSLVLWNKERLRASLWLLLWCLVIVLTVYSSTWWSYVLWGWPLPYWLAAQGSLLVFGAIVWIYAWMADTQPDLANSDET